MSVQGATERRAGRSTARPRWRPLWARASERGVVLTPVPMARPCRGHRPDSDRQRRRLCACTLLQSVECPWIIIPTSKLALPSSSSTWTSPGQYGTRPYTSNGTSSNSLSSLLPSSFLRARDRCPRQARPLQYYGRHDTAALTYLALPVLLQPLPRRPPFVTTYPGTFGPPDHQSPLPLPPPWTPRTLATLSSAAPAIVHCHCIAQATLRQTLFWQKPAPLQRSTGATVCDWRLTLCFTARIPPVFQFVILPHQPAARRGNLASSSSLSHLALRTCCNPLGDRS